MTAPRVPGQRYCGRCGKPTATAIGIPTEKGIVRPRPYCDDHRADAEAARDAEIDPGTRRETLFRGAAE